VQLPPLALSFPDEPTTELAPIQPRHEKSAAPPAPTLPPLSSVTGSSAHAPLPKPPEPSHPRTLAKPPNHWPSLNPFTTYYTPSYLDPVESSTSMGSDPGVSQRSSSVSLDDPDVRIAAEALGQMRTGASAEKTRDGCVSATSDTDPSSCHLQTVPPPPAIEVSLPPPRAMARVSVLPGAIIDQNQSPFCRSSQRHTPSSPPPSRAPLLRTTAARTTRLTSRPAPNTWRAT
jgi:hypothetical protein